MNLIWAAFFLWRSKVIIHTATRGPRQIDAPVNCCWHLNKQWCFMCFLPLFPLFSTFFPHLSSFFFIFFLISVLTPISYTCFLLFFFLHLTFSWEPPTLLFSFFPHIIPFSILPSLLSPPYIIFSSSFHRTFSSSSPVCPLSLFSSIPPSLYLFESHKPFMPPRWLLLQHHFAFR